MGYKIKVDRIWDGVSDSYISSKEIFVENGKIVDSLPKAELIDLTGYTLMPGLINAHIHLVLHGDLDVVTVVKNDNEAVTAIKAAENARKTIMSGVTTVRTLGDHFTIAKDIKSMVDSGVIIGPRIQHAGFPICMTGGHGWFFGREVDGVDEARKAAREQLKQGATWIKVMATGGILTPGVSPEVFQLNEDEMRAAIEEAHKAEKHAATHAQGASGVNNALRAGVDTVEHGFYLDNESIELFLEKDAWLVPTIIAPTSTIHADIPQYAKDKAKKALDGLLERLEKAIKAGVKIGCGSDAGTPCNGHDTFYREIIELSKTSLGKIKALKCATSINARMLHIDKEVGRIATGLCADLIAFKGDVLSDINVLANVDWVMKDGKVVKSEI
jgi:imidazolonepropionase-like amidohydrolase